jgi:hypothetical protein
VYKSSSTDVVETVANVVGALAGDAERCDGDLARLDLVKSVRVEKKREVERRREKKREEERRREKERKGEKRREKERREEEKREEETA